jgi:hypothetical protein
MDSCRQNSRKISILTKSRSRGEMSELDVIVIHIRAEQAEEYERLFAERELPRWREYKARGAFISARSSRRPRPLGWWRRTAAARCRARHPVRAAR